MKNTNLLLLGILLLGTLNSCKLADRFKYYSIYVQVNELTGLKIEDPVMLNMDILGKVVDIDENEEDGFVVELFISNDYQIPRGSELRIATDLDNSRAYFDIEASHSKKFYSKGDTIKSLGKVLLNNDIRLEEVELNLDSMAPEIRQYLQ